MERDGRKLNIQDAEIVGEIGEIETNKQIDVNVNSAHSELVQSSYNIRDFSVHSYKMLI